jgi:uncharacterized caspase-like protein
MKILSIIGALVGLAVIGLVFTGGLDYLFYSVTQKGVRSAQTANTSNSINTIVVEPSPQVRPVDQTAIPNQTPPTTPIFVGKRVALVIGNAKYKTNALANPKNDADDISKALNENGFTVINLRDASLPEMRSAVRQFGDKLIQNDVGLVYYSGHAMEVKGRNYFIPVNADIQNEDEVPDQSLDASLILEKMATAKKKVNILMVDACRDNPYARSFRSASKGLSSMDAPSGTLISFATAPGKVAYDGSGRNSPYMKHFLEAIKTPNLGIEQVFKEVRKNVQAETKNLQTPWENTSLSGDFYFKVKND